MWRGMREREHVRERGVGARWCVVVTGTEERSGGVGTSDM